MALVRKLALAAPLAVLASAGPAAALSLPGPERVELDGDAGRESVRIGAGTPTPGDSSGGVAVSISDRCPAGRVDVPVAGPQEEPARLSYPSADTRRGREVFADLRSGARRALGEARLVAWRRARGPFCRRPRELFGYSTDRPTRSPRGTTREVTSFTVRVARLSRRFRGREGELVEQFRRPSDPPNSGSMQKRSRYRYSRRRDRYVRYSVRVRRDFG